MCGLLMNSSPFKLFLEFLLGPQATAGLVGLVGLIAYFITDKHLKGTLNQEDLVLASSKSIMDSIFGLFFILQAVYGLITVIFVVLLGMNEYPEIFYIYNWVSFDNTSEWNAKVSLVALFFGGLLYTLGTMLSGLNFFNIVTLKFDSRTRLLTNALTAHDQPSAGQSEQANHDASELEEDAVEQERTEPVTFSEILEALDTQLKEAIEEAHELRGELEETKSKVVTLEEEVKEKDQFIGEIEASKASLSEQIEEQNEEEDEKGKKLSLTDSVMVGDSIMGGMKIDKQINNDPDAIARAVIAAYRAGREDKL